ncbi:hypothetical protein CHLRE_09g395650v5 [Chlamydomonas reinhardtii]|uniref:Rieske-like [2Fe-2S] domain-containing protein n=1 Tax=Chlamydomonas reinhardtii TaxID=3055 RepID=A8IZY2_CHLRE|nr:uncharacterized protein CHLRE_09g395650v5 [Chlamydomonas reinhardtii]PNW78482.1 hypothetical protein CHLRE_09g395650v5 [Chlamydomonas reinhardtii]|eukprot:XP_001694493.1 predicted protein [Chlamydomonas reinhardtii]
MKTIAHKSLAPASHGHVVQARSVICRGGGFGKSNKKAETGGSGIYTAPKSKKRVDLVKELGLDNSAAAAAAPVVAAPASETELLSKGNWFPLAKLSDFAGEKKRKICELKGNKQVVVLHQYQDTIYATNAYSTAYQYPLIDAKIEDGPEGPTITTPLDGTIYDLKTGKVIKWVPSDGSPIRGLLRTLKADVAPVPLPVYPVVVKTDGNVMVRLS